MGGETRSRITYDARKDGNREIGSGNDGEIAKIENFDTST